MEVRTELGVNILDLGEQSSPSLHFLVSLIFQDGTASHFSIICVSQLHQHVARIGVGIQSVFSLADSMRL